MRISYTLRAKEKRSEIEILSISHGKLLRIFNPGPRQIYRPRPQIIGKWLIKRAPSENNSNIKKGSIVSQTEYT